VEAEQLQGTELDEGKFNHCAVPFGQ